MREQVIVLKFGSSVLRTDGDLLRVVGEVERWLRSCSKVVAVVSAIGDTTDRLRARARSIAQDFCEHSLAELLSTGESTSAALLGLALHNRRICARVIKPSDVGLRTSGPPLDSRPCSIDVGKFEEILADVQVVVFPGFFGHDSITGRTSLLGRGGSDWTAVFLADQLGASRCRLLKDVDGVYDADPNVVPHAIKRSNLCWDEVLRSDAPVIQHRALQYAWSASLPFEVAAVGSDTPTFVGERRK